MIRFPVQVSCLGLLALGGPSPKLGADSPPTLLREDPRVADAVEAWKLWVEYQDAVERVPALSLGVVHGQELLAADAFGYANPESGAPARPDTL